MTFDDVFFSRLYDGKPLFKRQKEMVDIYESLKSTGMTESEMTVSSFRTLVSKLTSGERILTDKLKQIFVEVLTFKIKNEQLLKAILSDVEYLISDAITSRQSSNALLYNLADSSETEFNELINQEGLHIFITDIPIEILDTEDAVETRKKILNNLGMFNNTTEELRQKINEGRIPFTYLYYVYNRAKAIKIWKKMYNDLLNTFNVRELNEKFELLCKGKLLRTYYVDKISASHNLYFYNIAKERDGAKIIKLYKKKDFSRWYFNLPKDTYEGLHENVFQEIDTNVVAEKEGFGVDDFKRVDKDEE